MDNNEVTSDQSAEAPDEVLQPVDPPDSRFLFVDIAAMRAKQLRRGALPRLHHAGDGGERHIPHKLERVAMEEVRLGIIAYDLPALGAGRKEQGS